MTKLDKIKNEHSYYFAQQMLNGKIQIIIIKLIMIFQNIKIKES